MGFDFKMIEYCVVVIEVLVLLYYNKNENLLFLQRKRGFYNIYVVFKTE